MTTETMNGEEVDVETGEVLPVTHPDVVRGSELERRQKVSGMLRPVAQPEDVLAAQTETRNLVSKALEEGRDFGTIPGTHKPSLLKPGAERINAAFGVAPRYRVTEREIDHDREVHWQKQNRHGEREGTSYGLYRYVVECELVHRESGVPVGQGIGSCSTMESKYIDRPRDLENTVLKMAQKRAFIAATLNAYGLSDQFTQDIEDNPSAFGSGSSGPFSLDDTLTFGKHKGETWADVLESDAGYVEWCIDNMDRLSEEAKEALSAALEGDEVPEEDVTRLRGLMDVASMQGWLTDAQAARCEEAAQSGKQELVDRTLDWLRGKVKAWEDGEVDAPEPEKEEDEAEEAETVAAGDIEDVEDGLPF